MFLGWGGSTGPRNIGKKWARKTMQTLCGRFIKMICLEFGN